MRRNAIIILLVTAIVAGLGWSIGVAQNQTAKSLVESMLQDILSSEGRQVIVEDVNITLDGDVSAEKVEIRDDTGAWLVIEKLKLDWQPLSLLAESLRIDSLTVEKVLLDRLPAPVAKDEEINTPKELTGLRNAVISRFAITDLELSPELAGEKFQFKIDGSGTVNADPAEVRIQVSAERQNVGDSVLKADVRLDPATRAVDVDMRLTESRNGLVVRMLNMPDDPAIDLQLKASGSIDEWSGRFSLTGDQTLIASGRAEVVTNDTGRRLTIDADGEIGRLVPPRFAGVLDGTTQLVGNVQFETGRSRARIERIRIGNQSVQLRLAGPLDWAGDTTDLTVELRTDGDEPLDVVSRTAIGDITASGLVADLSVTGSLSTPRWQLAASARQLASDLARLDDTSLSFQGTGIDFADAGAEISGTATGTLMQGRSEVVPPMLLGPVKADLTASTVPEGRIRLSNTRLALGDFSIDLTGDLEPGSAAYQLNVAAQGTRIASGNKLIDGLLTGTVTLRGDIARDGQGPVRLDDVRLDSENLDARLTGTFGDTVNLTGAASIADLTSVDPRLSGSTEASFDLKGDRDAPLLTLLARSELITLVGAELTQPVLRADLQLNPERPAGTVNLTGTLRDLPLNAGADITTDADGTRHIKNLQVTSGSARLQGTVSLPRSGVPTGDLRLSAPRLDDIAPLLLQRLQGSLTAQLSLADEAGKSRIDTTFEGKDIVGDNFNVAGITGNARIEDARGRPVIDGSAALSSVTAGHLNFASVKAEARSRTDGSYTVDIHADGEPLSLNAVANVSTSGDGMLVEVAEIDGRAAGVAFAATRPFSIARSDAGALRVAKANLGVGSGRIELDGRLMPDFDAKLTVNALPLTPFEAVTGVGGLSGTLTGNAALTGTTDKPQAAYTLQASGVSVPQLTALGLSDLSADITGQANRRQLGINGRISASPGLNARINGEIAFVDGISFNLKTDGSLSTEPFANRLADAGVRLDARADFDLNLRGTPGKPDMSGRIRLSNATLGDASGRFVITDANATMELAGDNLRLVSLQGRTGRTGKVSGSGTVSLAAPYDASISVVIRDGFYSDGTLVNARYDADLNVSGPLAVSPLLQGEIRLRQTRITLSEIPPHAIKPLDVSHRHASARVRNQARDIARRAGGGASSLRLNLRITVVDNITVTGRGLNVLLGGRLDISGTPSALVTNGAFNLRRGSLKLLARRIQFERGRLDFQGDLDPRINFVAVSHQTDATIRLTISGRVSRPEIAVSSSPELPQEEALARLVFDRNLVQLAPLQIAQLASSIAVLSGGSGGGGLLGGLQSAVGVDWLEITETPSGETAIGIGKQITEKLSVGVEQTTQTNTSRVIIDLNLKRNFKLRGSAGSDGSTGAGVFFQKDY